MNPLTLNILPRIGASVFAAILALSGTNQAFAEAEADLLIAYDQTYSSSVGGEDNAQVITANSVAGCNDINVRSGTGARLRIVGYKQAAQNLYQTTSKGGFVNWMASYDAHMTDVVDAGNARGADLIAWLCVSTADGAAAVAQQPGRYSAFDPGQFWSAVVAHELGGHNFSLDHRGGKGDLPAAYPKSVMMHNYCNGGGTSPPYLYSNPNIWVGGVRMQGIGSTCLGDAVSGGDNAYLKSTTCQGVADSYARIITGPNLGNVVRRWSFNQTAGTAPAATTVVDSITGTELATVQGNGASFTGSGLQIPGGASGSGAAYLQLPSGVISSYANVTIEIWAKENSAQNYSRVLDFNNGTANYLCLSACIGTDLNSQRFESVVGGTTVTLDSGLPTATNVLHHYAITYASTGASTGRWTWYRDGDQVAYLDVAYALTSFPDVNNWLGRSAYASDSLASCEYQEVRISNVAMSRDEILANYTLGANKSSAIVRLNAEDAVGSASFAAAGSWSDGLAPSAGKTYETYRFRLRTPADAASRTFAGQSLNVDGGSITWKGTASSTLTVNDLTVSGDCELLHAGSGTWTLAGNLKVNSELTTIRAANGAINLSANLSGSGDLLHVNNTVTLSGNNTNFTGKTIIGDGRFSGLSIDSEARLGANPTNFVADQLTLNRGILYNSGNVTISNSNRGIRVGVSAAIFDVASGATTTLAVPLSSPASGATLQTSPIYPNPVSGMLIKQNSGTLVLTHPNNSHAGEIAINAGTLTVSGAGRLNNGDQAMPVINNATMIFNSTANQTISGVISGAGSLAKTNSGTLTLTGANTMSGAVTVNGGTLYANAANAANNRALSFVSGITVNSGGTLRSSANGLFGSDGTQEKPVTVNAGGTLTCDSAADVGVGTVTLNGGTLANLGASTTYGSWRFDEATDRLLVTDDSNLSAVNVKFGNRSAFINVSAGKTLTVNGTITDATTGGASYLTLSNGTGTVLINSANSYSGTTLIGAGRLVLGSSASLASSNIITGNSATFDSSNLPSPFTVGSGKALGGNGTNNGPVTTVSGAKIVAGMDGGYGTNTFNQDLTLVSGAALYFDLGGSVVGANDKLVVLGNLNLNNTVVHLKAPSPGANLDPSSDYLLATVAGTLSGAVNPTPVWDVQAGNFGAFAVMVTNGNQIVLHAVSTPPSFAGGSAVPASAGRNQNIFISVAPVQGLYALSNITANAASIGGPAAATLFPDGAGNYTNSFAATPDTTFGAKNIAVTVTDIGNISSVTNFSISIVAANRIWNGGSASDNNWSSNPNWSASAAPGFVGDSLTFGGSTRLTPLMETNYTITGLMFDNTAGNFTLTAAGRFLTLTGFGVTNNSAAAQIISVPISMSAAQTLSASAGNLTFSQNITNNGNLLTLGGASNITASANITGIAGLLKTGTGALTLSGASTYSGTTVVNAGTLNVTGSLPSTNITYVGGAAGKATVTVSGNLKQQNLFVGNSLGATGAVYQTAGTITVTNGGGDGLNVGNIAGGWGYYNISGGTTLANGIAVGGENNSGTGFSGTGGNGLFEISGGTVNNLGWCVMARGDTNETGVLNVFGGLFAYNGGGISACWGTNQNAIINVLGGVVSNTAVVGINLNRTGYAANTGIMNLNGGTAQANSVSGGNARLNFNGGVLKASAANASFISGLSAATIYTNGATINNNGFAIAATTPLLAPTGNGVNGIASFTSGAGYIAPPIITVNRGAGDTTGVGATAIAQIDRNAGTVTNILITCPGVNYTATPTFTLSGGGATTPATITGQAPTPNTSGGFTMTGAGTLTLSAGNSYSGNTLINGGTLRFARPLLQMSFDTVIGTTVVNQGSGGAAMNGTLTGTATIVSGGRFGNALSIPSGASSAAYVLITNSVVPLDATGNWSVGLWVKTGTAGGAYLNQSDGGWGSGNTTFYLNNGSGAGTKAGGVRYAQGWEQGTKVINDGQWHFIVLTAGGGIKRQYVDGALDALVTDAWNSTGAGGQLRIGGTGTGEADGQVGLNGLIDEVYVFDRPLALVEIQSLYNANKLQPLSSVTPVTVASGANFDLSGYSQTIASLAGAGKVTNSGIFATTLTLSNNTGTTTFSGTIADLAATNAVSLVQSGAATNIFSGANTYRGISTIQGGTFLVNGSLGTNIVSVTNGGTLGGNGTINGAVTIQNTGNLSPGSGIGILTLNSAVLQAGSATILEISKSPATNDQVRVIGALTLGGTLTVTNISGTLAANDSFKVFNAGSTSGAFTATNLPPLNAGLAWNFNPVSGLLSIVQTVATNPTNLVFNVVGNALALSWPADHLGWRLQTQSNSLASGLGTNWSDVAGSQLTNAMFLPLDALNGSVFYRMVYP